MIVCLQGGELPAIDLSSDTTQKVGSRTLTQVVCAALYGVALKPGREQGSLHAACASLRLEGRALWRDESGPGWLRPHLELIAQSKTWPFDPDSRDDAEGITLSHFAAAQRWLTKSRRLGFAHGLPSELAEKVIRLANMTDAEAIADAFAEADRIERAEGAVNAMAAEFYKLLSDAIATQRLTLKAISTHPRANAWLPKTPGEPPHQAIPTDYFELPLVHNLFDNVLEADRFSPEANLLDSIFERNEAENEGLLIKWSDVKVPPEQADWLLSRFRNEGKAAGHNRSLSATSKPENATNWLSLAGAIIWVVTRDLDLTRLADRAADNDHGIEAGIYVHLAQQAAEGQTIKMHMMLKEAWPTLRRLIADEKIVAEGRSLERWGMSTAVETRYPNDQIPSGDAANLIILSDVPGIAPSDALASDEIYRFTNGQGRYWYDVRLRAADVVREFPGESNRHAPEEVNRNAKSPSRGDGDLLQAAFDACYPEGVPRGTKPGEVFDALCKWIRDVRKRKTPPVRRTFDRHRKNFWRDRPDAKPDT